MAEVTCFMIEPTEEGIESFRRFSWGVSVGREGHGAKPQRACPAQPVAGGYQSGHDANTGPLGVVPCAASVYVGEAGVVDRADPRWPTTCRCGYVFQDDDQWQHTIDRLYVRKETYERWTLREAPPGAMWRCLWFEQRQEDTVRPRWVGPDGFSLAVKLPGGHDWNIDGPSNNGPGWTRTGTPPRITATPSIGVNKAGGGYAYHGWLRDGVLRDA